MRSPSVPGLARRLLALSLHPADRRFALADLEEEFERRSATLGPAAGRRWYRNQTARSFLPALRNRMARTPFNPLGNLIEDTRFAVRSLAKTPVVAIVTVLSLAVGIGVATTVFTTANAFLFRPLSRSIAEPDELMAVFTMQEDAGSFTRTSFPDYLDIADQVDAFESVAAIRMAFFRIGEQDDARRVIGEIVTGNYMRVLGVTMPLGRGFLPDEAKIGAAERVAVISHRLWQQRYGGDSGVLGKTVRLDGNEYTIVGVAPADLVGRLLAMKVDVWLPLGIPGGVYHSDEQELEDRAFRTHSIVARLAEDAGMQEAQAQLDTVAARLHETHGRLWEDDHERPLGLGLLAGRDGSIPPDVRTQLGVFAGVVILVAGLVLWVACTNVAGLFLARAGQRSREMAVRLAIGASRQRLVTMLLTESVLLGLTSGVLGVLFASQAVGMFDSLALPIGGIQLEFDFVIDRTVLAFAVLLSIGTTVLFGLAPAVEGSRPSLLPSLKGDGGSLGRRYRKFGLRNLLVIGQVATALIFVVGAAVALSSFAAMMAHNWGADGERIAVMSKPAPAHIADEALVSWYAETQARLSALPSVARVHLARSVEGTLMAVNGEADVAIAGYEPAPLESMTIPFNAITPGYFETLGIQLRSGRAIDEHDVDGARAVAVVSERFAQRFWKRADVVGERFQVVAQDALGDRKRDHDQTLEIVGVTVDAPYQGFETGGHLYFWTSLIQQPARNVVLILQGRDSAAAMLPILQGEIDPDEKELALFEASTFADLQSFEFGGIRIMAQVLAWVGAFGLALSAIGIYGIVSFSVNRRRKEMAIRTAVGALPRQVVRSVLGEGLRLASWGLGAGLLIVVPLSAALRSGLEGLSAIEPVSVGLGAAILLTVALLASWVPARRVAQLDPVASLQGD